MKTSFFAAMMAIMSSAVCVPLFADTNDDVKIIDLWQDNSDANYVTYTSSLRMTAAKPVEVYTARYTEYNGSVKGEGSLSFFCGGERTWLGTKNGASYPSWSGFSGDFHIYPYPKKEGCGFYGLVLSHGGKTFNPEDIAGSLEKTNSELAKCKVFLHNGATLALWTGVRGVRIAELNTEEGSMMIGPAKNGASNGAYFVLGLSGNDATLAGQIAPSKNDLATKVGIIKEGKGTCRVTGNHNLVTGSIRVTEGRVLLNNDIAAAQAEKLSGAIGALGDSNPGMYVFENAAVGGFGHSASIIDLYGNLEPGDDNVGTLSLADFQNQSDVALRLRPTSKLHFEISSSESYDRLNVSGALDYWNICQDFSQSDATPIIYIEPTEGNSIKAGDSFTLISAKKKSSRDGEPWAFRVQFPKCFSWEVSEMESEAGVAVVATVTSLDYSGQGDVDVENGNQGGSQGDDNNDDNDDFDETSDPTPLREYAEQLGKFIGVATPCWSYSLTNFNDPNTQTIGREFNMIVSENGMKYENTEQSKNSFSYSLGDAAVSLGTHYNCLIRGHVFAWHKQNPAWITENDNKNSHNYSREELLGFLKNHIFKVAAHFKGKVTEWDVVNECLSDDQTAIRNNPDAYDLRHSVWFDGIGEDFVDSAFVWAHEADPTLKLYLTDYGAEFKGVAKTEALYNLAKRLLASGIPLDGVGLQCHLDAGEVDEKKLAATVESYKALGLECIITELDMGCDGTPEGLEQQAKSYAAVTRVWLQHDNCPKLMIWGLKDSDSWRGSNPLLFTGGLAKKPAYYAVHRQLRKAATAASVETPLSEPKSVVATRFYNLQGQLLSEPQSGMLIEETIFSDNSRQSTLRLHK